MSFLNFSLNMISFKYELLSVFLPDVLELSGSKNSFKGTFNY